MPRNKRRQGGLHNRGITDCCAPASYYCCGVPSSAETTQQTHIFLPGLESRTPVCRRANPAVAVVRYSRCRAGGFRRAAVGCVCAVGQSCAVCVLAMWLEVGLSQALTTSEPHGILTYAIFWYVRTTYGEISQQPGVV